MLSLVLSGVIAAAVALTSSADSAHAHEYEYGVCDCGEIESGYTKIYTKADLDKIRNNLGGKYVLMNDIIITSEDFPYVSSYYNNETGWLPIGCDFDMGAYYYKFYGVFNGNGHSIENLWMDRTPHRQTAYPATTTASYGNAGLSYDTPHAFGLFACNDGVIANLHLSVDYTVNANPYAVVGAIAGVNSGLITNCSTDGRIYAVKDITSGDSDFGGIAGWLANGTVTKCHSNVELGGKNASEYPYINFGGIIGATAGVGKCSISLSFNTGSIYPDSKSGGYLGGIVGRASCGTYQNGFSLLISDCYNTGFIGKADYVGRVAGICAEYYGSMDLKIERCYSIGDLGEKRVTAGILQTSISSDTSRVESSYYLDSTADAYMCNYNTGTLVDGYALTLKEMCIEDSYVGFDFENTWIIVGSSGYKFPQLRENFQTETDHTAHSFNEYNETEPTCYSEGVHRKICTECGYFVDTVVPKTPHDYTANVYPATCVENGYTRYVCRACENEYSDDFVQATGHTYGENGICIDCAHPDPDFTPDDSGENNPDGNDPDNTNPDGDPDNGGSDNDPDGDVTDPDENQSVTKPTDPDKDNVQNAVTESCACKCHHTGFIGFLFKIINLINQLFGINPTCQCGVAHYVKPD